MKTLEEGHLHFTLDGERMKGEWVMFRLKPRGKERGENWILKKVDDAYAGSPTGLTETYLTSVKTGRTMNEIAEGKKAPSAPPRTRGPSRTPKLGSRLRGSTMPKFREPQKATLVDAVPAGAAWLHEMKYDGYRCLLALAGGEAKIYTRTGLDWTDKFPEIAEAAGAIHCDSALLDGEIVALDDKGNTGFSALQQAIKEGGRGLTLFLFDALEIDGEKLDKRPNIERKQRLGALLGEGAPPFILYADHILGKGEQLFDAMCAAGQEGIISKKADAPYRGARTKNWLKVKCTRRQEFVIIGWSESDKKGRGFRSLLLGAERGRQAALRRQGRHRLFDCRPARPPREVRRDRGDQGARRSAPRRSPGRPLAAGDAGRRGRLRRIHRRQCRPPRQLPRPARRQEGEGNHRRNAPAPCSRARRRYCHHQSRARHRS